VQERGAIFLVALYVKRVHGCSSSTFTAVSRRVHQGPSVRPNISWGSRSTMRVDQTHISSISSLLRARAVATAATSLASAGAAGAAAVQQPALSIRGLRSRISLSGQSGDLEEWTGFGVGIERVSNLQNLTQLAKLAVQVCAPSSCVHMSPASLTRSCNILN
jgi:hypothetical protein